MTILDRIRGGLIVSCQASADSPFYEGDGMAKMAVAAVMGGAKGIRVDGPRNVELTRERVDVPIIGINKKHFDGYDVYITPDFTSAKEVADAGADIIAIDGTPRKRPGQDDLKDLIARIRDELGLLVMADCSTVEEGVNAARAGADIVATTLSGYTEYSVDRNGPDIEMVDKLVQRVNTPVIGEGRYSQPQQIIKAFEVGAHAIVIGGAITVPEAITARFVNAIPNRSLHDD